MERRHFKITITSWSWDVSNAHGLVDTHVVEVTDKGEWEALVSDLKAQGIEFTASEVSQVDGATITPAQLRVMYSLCEVML